MLPRVTRAALFALAGLTGFAYWALAHPSFEQTEAMSEWPTVLLFSAMLLSLAAALPAFGSLVGGRWALRLAGIAGAAVGLAGIANIFEDGLGLDWVYAVFILCALLSELALVALSAVIARTTSETRRLLALVPLATGAGAVLMVVAGGPILLVTWLIVAAVASARSRRTHAQAASTSP